MNLKERLEQIISLGIPMESHAGQIQSGKTVGVLNDGVVEMCVEFSKRPTYIFSDLKLDNYRDVFIEVYSTVIG